MSDLEQMERRDPDSSVTPSGSLFSDPANTVATTPGSRSSLQPAIPIRLVVLLAIFGLVLTLTVIEGAFIVDEPNYLVSVVGLQHGRLTLPGTENLTPSPELAYFDAAPRKRLIDKTPVCSVVPPLWSVLALPFSFLGWRGLAGLNTLAFVVAIAMTFALARRFAHSAWTPWLAAGTFAFASYMIEYAQGVMPHLLSSALCLGAFLATVRLREGGAAGFSTVAGLLAGLASGVRYQNIVFAGALALGLLIWGPRRWRSVALFCLGIGLPLLATSLMNHSRLATWNPISKGSDYLRLGVVERALGRGGAIGASRLQASQEASPWSRAVVTAADASLETGRTFAAKVLDFSLHPSRTFGKDAFFLTPNPESGAFVIFSRAVKKAWAQSCPWILLSLYAMASAWARRSEDGDPRRSREIRAVSVVVFAVVGTFAIAGTLRDDGSFFNQRYFIDLVPLAAVVLAWAVERLPLRATQLSLGALAGFGLAGLFLALPFSSSVRQVALMKVPLVLGATLLAAWILARDRRLPTLLPLALGACLSWACAVHLGDDLRASREWRSLKARYLTELAGILPDHSAIFTWKFIAAESAAPLQLDRDLVILDAWIDEGRTAPILLGELAAQGRRIFVALDRFPGPALDELRKGYVVRPVVARPLPVIELIPK